jgi:hypothetical protein
MGLRRGWIIAVPVVALAIVGCGSSGGSGSSESTSATTEGAATALTKAELIEQGDAICAKVNTAVDGVNPESPSATAQVAGLYGGMVKSLKDLGNPQETEGEYGEYLRTSNELAIALNELKLAAESESSGLETAEKTAEGALSAFRLHAGAYGFKECSRGS